MISDKERRDVAEGLRGLEGECVPLAYVLDELGVDCDGADVPKAHVERLADLIDRQTCRDEDCLSRSFSCSACGYEAWTYDDYCCDPKDFSFCPNCGAEVVRDDD